MQWRHFRLNERFWPCRVAKTRQNQAETQDNVSHSFDSENKNTKMVIWFVCLAPLHLYLFSKICWSFSGYASLDLLLVAFRNLSPLPFCYLSLFCLSFVLFYFLVRCSIVGLSSPRNLHFQFPPSFGVVIMCESWIGLKVQLGHFFFFELSKSLESPLDRETPSIIR